MDLLTREGPEIINSQKKDKIVAITHAIDEGMTTLRQLDVIGSTEHRSHGIGVKCDQIWCSGEVQGELNPHKLDILLTANGKSSIDNWEKNLRVSGNGSIINPVAIQSMKGWNIEMAEVHPAVLEETAPITHDSFDR